MGKLKDWVDEDWVRIDSQGNIAGKCGTSKNKKILTGAYLDQKLIVLASLKGLRRLVRKSAKALKESKLFQTPKPPKW